MKYLLRKDTFNDFNIIKQNTLKERSYFIPYPSFDEATSVDLLNKRYASKKVMCLNGLWDMKFYDNPNELYNNLKNHLYDTSIVDFDKIMVPSCLEYLGYGRAQYLNCRYPFKYDAPNVPTNEPVTSYYSTLDKDGILNFKNLFKEYPIEPSEYNHIAVYRKYVEIRDLSKNYILSFLGVASCMELYVNSTYVGYSEESHNTKEFDITNTLVNGTNEILVVVHRWCNGSYLECQDMFRNMGIFRDVLLRVDDKEDFFEFEMKMKKNDSLYDLDLTVTFNTRYIGKLKVTLFGHRKYLTKDIKVLDNTVKVSFNKLDVIEWNAEEPTLYDLVFEIPNSCVDFKIGFKDISILKDRFYLNRHLIKIRGVNHHDTTYTNGYTMTPEEILRDLKLCKEYNVNTIRTSHYAPDPLLIELAGEMGLYIIDECDLETHGVQNAKYPFSMNTLSDDKKWKEHYLSRIISHYNRDKMNITPIIMWSLGNESGDGCNTYSMYQYLKDHSDIPVHYEGAVHSKRKAYDVGSQMYASVDDILAIGRHESKIKEFNERPYILCEYAHAMGVGPGNLEKYMDAFYQYDNLMGGCIWEMNDHSIMINDCFSYGGDSGECLNDQSFCCDGLFYPDRTPSTGAYIMKHAYRVFRIKYLGNNRFEIFNTLNFKNSKYLKIVAVDNSNNEYEISSDIEPECKIEVEVPILDNIEYLDFRTYLNDELVDTSQFLFTYSIIKKKLIQATMPKNFGYVNGKIYLDLGDKRVATAEQSTILYRAGTDNDKHLFYFKTMEGWYDQQIEIVDEDISSKRIKIVKRITANKNVFLETVSFVATNEGILVESTLTPVRVKGKLPRYGHCYYLDSSFDDVTYLGCDKESYADMIEHSVVKENHYKVCEMVEPNIRPQESGNRMSTKYVEVTDGDNIFRIDATTQLFELGVKPYTDLALTKMKHRSDEERTGTYITISRFQQGIGTGSCGPEVNKEFTYKARKKYKLTYLITWKAKEYTEE